MFLLLTITERQVDDIVSFKPDVIFVQNHVARYAQEYLMEQGICVFVNIKPKAMRILSRVSPTTTTSLTDARFVKRLSTPLSRPKRQTLPLGHVGICI